MQFHVRACCAAVLLLSAGVSVSAADDLQPESLLPKNSVLYLQFDGFAEHQKTLDKTILAELLSGELKPLTDSLQQAALNALGPDLVGQMLLAGADPDDLVVLQNSAKKLPLVVELLSQRGFVLGLEAVAAPVPGAQLTMVLPGGGQPEQRDAVFAALRLVAAANKVKINENTIEEREVLQMPLGGPVLSCWTEGDHMVLAAGTLSPATVIARAKGEGDTVTASPLYEELKKFDGYETYARLFFDAQQLMQFASGLFPPAAQSLAETGLSGLQNVSIQFGSSGEILRQTTTVQFDGPPRGLMAAMFSTTPLDFDLPKLAPDITSVAATTIQPGELYQASIKALETAIRFTEPGQLAEFQTGLADFEKRMGGNLPEELDECVGPGLAIYNSPSEGMSFFGMGLAVQVKDEQQFSKLLKRFMQTVAGGVSQPVNIRQQAYRGGVIDRVEFANNSTMNPCYTMQDGWCVLGLNTQIPQGVILRSSGEFSSWEPGELLKRGLAEAESTKDSAEKGKSSRVIGISQIDPRSTVTTLISYVGLIATFTRATGQDASWFDPSVMPHVQAVSERLKPNASVYMADQNSIRIESYDTLPLPADFSGFSSGYGSLLYLNFAFSFAQ